MFLFPTTPSECVSIIERMKNVKYGINIFPVKLFKHFKFILSHPISYLINQSFSFGLFPDSLKSACVTPLFKSGETSNIANYRPISILPFLSKLFEKAIVTRILSFSNSHNLFSSHQFGFLQNRSTCDAILELVEFIYRTLNNKTDTVALFLDLRRAFDTVNHDILLKKLDLYGFRGNILSLIKSYLSNRTQCVRIGNSFSSLREIDTGVGQGSLIGPILFIFYINDLPLVSNTFNTILYADDTTFFVPLENSLDFFRTVNSELDNISQWFNSNRLSVNLDKTYVSLFSLRNNVFLNNFLINHEILKFGDKGRFLGIFFDQKLNFSYHVKHICTKLSKTIGIFYKIFKFIPFSTRVSLYYSLFYPYLLYCNLIWGGASPTIVQPIFLLQKRAVRLICGEGYLAHTNPLFFRTKILKFSDIHTFLLCLYFHQNFSKFSTPDHAYDTRNRDFYIPTFQRLSICQRSLEFSAPSAWNRLPIHLKNIKKYSTFKNKLKIYLLESYR